MDKNKYMESILRRLLWIYCENHAMAIDYGYRLEGYTESQWLGMILQHTKKALGLPGLIDNTVLPKREDSVRVVFLNPVTKKIIELPFAHYMANCEFPLNGIRTLDLNVKKEFMSSFEEKANFVLQLFSGKKAIELIPEVEKTISLLETKSAVKGELETLHYLLTMAQMRPDSIVFVDQNEVIKE